MAERALVGSHHVALVHRGDLDVAMTAFRAQFGAVFEMHAERSPGRISEVEVGTRARIANGDVHLTNGAAVSSRDVRVRFTPGSVRFV